MNKTPMSGVTLVEFMLVLAVASSIIMLAMKQYRMLKVDSDVNQVLVDVDQIFQAASYFYQANCKMQQDPVNGPIGGTGQLDPSYFPAPPAAPTPTPPANPFPITVTDLRSGGFLTSKVMLSSIINTNSVNDGFMVQFNMNSSDRTFDTTPPVTTVKLGKIIVWRIQVAALLRDPSKALQYKNLFRADCLSTLDPSGTTVTPCSVIGAGVPSPPIYVVWTRLPSYATPESNSNAWITNASMKEFNQLYETYPVSYLQGVPASSYPAQNYLCGS
jgi:hypothetical protein